MIYLDNAATTKVAPEVLDAMIPYYSQEYGNSESIHEKGRRAAEAIEQARSQVGSLIGAEPEQIVFTSCGSESNTIALAGMMDTLLKAGKTHLIVSATEHHSILECCSWMEQHGFSVTYLPVSSEGVVEMHTLEKAMTPLTGLVSIMHVNNETGAVNPIEEIAAFCHRHGAYYHTDSVQGAGSYKLDMAHSQVDMLSVSAHKFHAPKGVGCLFVRNKGQMRLTPAVFGVEEDHLRGGTENTAGIVGFGKAACMAKQDLEDGVPAAFLVRQTFVKRLLDNVGGDLAGFGAHLNGSHPASASKIVNIRFDGVDGQSLLLMLDSMGLCVSAGSACTSHMTTPSHVLTAMGLSEEQAKSSLRFSFSKYNTAEEVERAADIVVDCVKAMREYRGQEEQ